METLEGQADAILSLQMRRQAQREVTACAHLACCCPVTHLMHSDPSPAMF